MPATWQCDDCGTTYRVAWLSHCYRCEALPRAPKQQPKTAKPSRRTRMPRIVAGVGPSNAAADALQPEPVEDVTEGELDAVMADATPVEVVAEPAAPAVGPEPVADAAPVVPETVSAPVAVVDAPVAAPKGGAQ